MAQHNRTFKKLFVSITLRNVCVRLEMTYLKCNATTLLMFTSEFTSLMERMTLFGENVKNLR